MEVIPIPVYYPDRVEILGRRCFRTVQAAAANGPMIDIVCVFRRSADVLLHLDDLVAAAPQIGCVWLQSGIRNDVVAQRMADLGVPVVQDRCLLVDHRDATAAAGAAASSLSRDR